MRLQSPTTAGVLFALVTACGLGSITTQAKLFYADNGDALTLMLVRFVVSALVFGMIWQTRGGSFSVERKQRLPLLLLGVFWSGGMLCYLRAVETISVSLAVLIFYTYPLLVLFWSILRRQTPASVALISLFVGAFAGLYLMVSGGEFSPDPVGILLAGLASLGAAFTFVCGARVAPRVPPLLMVVWINAAGLIVILPVLGDGLSWPAGSAGAIALAVATVLYLIAILSQFEALARLSAARAAIILNLEPVVSILMARLVIGEVLNPVQWIGVVLVLGVVLMSLRFNPAAA